MTFLEFLALTPALLLLSCYFLVILWIFLETLVRTYFAFLDREYIPTWITRNFHHIFINLFRLSLYLMLISLFFVDFKISNILMLALFFTSYLTLKPSRLKLYNQDKNDSTPLSSDVLR